MSTTRADRTAIRRSALSRPVALALDDGLIHQARSFFDYGCGRGDDLLRLHKLGIPVSGWDPAFFPDEERAASDIVSLGYVVNVIEDPDERVVVLTAAWELARKVLIVSARLDWEATDTAVDFQGDGIVTAKRTFQKFLHAGRTSPVDRTSAPTTPSRGGSRRVLRVPRRRRRTVIRREPGRPAAPHPRRRTVSRTRSRPPSTDRAAHGVRHRARAPPC